MPQPRPSCTLIMDIDEGLVDEEMRQEVARCYTHVGTALVRPHASSPDSENTMRLLARLGNRKYLHSDDEGADELWDEVMERWFYNQFHNVGNNMVIYNKRQEEEGTPELFFDWLEIELEDGDLYVRLHLDSNSTIAPEKSALVTAARTAYNDGTLGAGVTRISMPAPASYAEQRDAGLAAKEARVAAEEAAAEAEEAAREAEAAKKAAEAEENFLGTPQETDEDRAAAEEAEYRAELENRYGVPEADFEIDYTLWEVEYADGSTRAFDSKTRKFAD